MRDNLAPPEALSEWDFRILRGIAAYQFGSQKIADCIFPSREDFFVQRSMTTGKIRNILYKDKSRLYLVLRAQDLLFSLTLSSAQRIKECTESPVLRVVVPSSISEFIREGRNVFAKFVINVDLNLRTNDEALIVDENDKLLAIGKMKLSGQEVKQYKKGVAVHVKRGAEDLD